MGTEDLAPPPPGFEPQTVQKSKSRDTNYCKTFHIKKSVLKTTYISRANNFEFLDHEFVSHGKPMFPDFPPSGRGTHVYETVHRPERNLQQEA